MQTGCVHIGDVLPVAIGQDMLLFGEPLLGGFEATTAAGFGLAALAEKAGTGAVAEGVAVFVEIAAPDVVMLEQQLCGAGNIHGAESTGRQRTGKVHRH